VLREVACGAKTYRGAASPVARHTRSRRRAASEPLTDVMKQPGLAVRPCRRARSSHYALWCCEEL